MLEGSMKRREVKTHQEVWQPGNSVEDGRAELEFRKTGWKFSNAVGKDPTA